MSLSRQLDARDALVLMQRLSCKTSQKLVIAKAKQEAQLSLTNHPMLMHANISLFHAVLSRAAL